MRPRWTTLLPPEHGSWAFLALPAAVGLMRRPSFSGGLLALAVLCAFLVRTPLQRLRGPRRHPDAMAWVSLLHPLGSSAALLALFEGSTHPLIAACIGAGLLVAWLVPAVWAVRRSLAWELGAAALLSLQAPAILRLGGATIREASLIWVFLALFTLPPIFYLRQRLDPKAGAARVRSSLATHAGAAALAFGAVWMGWAPLAFLLWAGLLAARAAWGASRGWRAGRGRRLGTAEALVSCIHMALLAGWGRL
ncbi:MAG TPA: YwiC-like family protein [Holophagaceae bacterium]|nr:YwiC-like family protein [Holophagaceae bacterium]